MAAWNFIGILPTGLVEGPPGDPGATGAAGATGATGPAGSTGATGPSGVIAATVPLTYNSGTQTVAATVGTTANTLAAGNDARIVGAAQKSANLSDLASVVTARTNLGLGTAATTAATAYDVAGAATTAQAAAIAAAAVAAATAIANQHTIDNGLYSASMQPVLINAGPVTLAMGYYYLVDASSGPITLTLPSAASYGTIYIEKTDASANAVIYSVSAIDLGGGLFTMTGVDNGDGTFLVGNLIDNTDGTFTSTQLTLARQGDGIELVGSNVTPNIWYQRTFYSGATAGAAVKRDSSGRAQVADPALAADIATKNYVDTRASVAPTIRTVATTTTANPGDVILANATTAGFTVTVPVTAGATVTVKKTDASVNAVTVRGASGLVDGDPNATLVGQDASAVFVGDGVNIQIEAINGLAVITNTPAETYTRSFMLMNQA